MMAYHFSLIPTNAPLIMRPLKLVGRYQSEPASQRANDDTMPVMVLVSKTGSIKKGGCRPSYFRTTVLCVPLPVCWLVPGIAGSCTLERRGGTPMGLVLQGKFYHVKDRSPMSRESYTGGHIKSSYSVQIVQSPWSAPWCDNVTLINWNRETSRSAAWSGEMSFCQISYLETQ